MTDTTTGSERTPSPRYRRDPLVAWTAERRNLGTTPQELVRGEEAVAVVRLPDGWPLVVQGPPALIWQEVAAAGDDGCTADELIAPWQDSGAGATVETDVLALLDDWEAKGLITRTDSPR